MGDEFKLVKDLATISATAAELAAVNRLITREIDSQDFLSEYNDLLLDITDTYLGLDNILQPLLAIDSQVVFDQRFLEVVAWYRDNYQPALSQPRVNAENTFQKYLQFRKRRETKTSYPLLKSAFARLHYFIDKWIDNDIWLALTIDALLKTFNRLLSELAEAASKDPEQAFAVFTSLTGSLTPYLAIIQNALQDIATTQCLPLQADSLQALSRSH